VKPSQNIRAATSFSSALIAKDWRTSRFRRGRPRTLEVYLEAQRDPVAFADNSDLYCLPILVLHCLVDRFLAGAAVRAPPPSGVKFCARRRWPSSPSGERASKPPSEICAARANCRAAACLGKSAASWSTTLRRHKGRRGCPPQARAGPGIRLDRGRDQVRPAEICACRYCRRWSPAGRGSVHCG
jgi:hypothetical protein